jgi:DNA-binding NarL/FixJ family response regulator
MRVLIADDHAIVRRTLKAILEEDGYEVCEAADGRDAIRQVRECNPSILIMDIAMPVMTGLDAAREILRERPELPIVLLSMHSLDSLRSAAAKIGVRGYVSKSRAVEDLGRAIEVVRAGQTYFAT